MRVAPLPPPLQLAGSGEQVSGRSRWHWLFLSPAAHTGQRQMCDVQLITASFNWKLSLSLPNVLVLVLVQGVHLSALEGKGREWAWEEGRPWVHTSWFDCGPNCQALFHLTTLSPLPERSLFPFPGLSCAT